MSANRRAAENVGPHLRMRNQASDAGNSFIANQIQDKFEFGCAFEKQSDHQHEGQRDKGMQMKQRHRCVNRKFNPPGQGTLPVSVGVDRGGFTFNAVTGLAGVIRLRQGYGGRADRSYRRLDKEFFAPVPEQNQTCRDRVEPAALRNEHG